MSDSEAALIERVRQHDEEALVEFIEVRRPQLLAFIERNLSDGLRRKVEPQDILQELTLSALNGFEEMDLTERDPFSWLCQLGERRIIDAHRRFIGAKKRSAEREVALDTGGSGDRSSGLIHLLVASMTTPSQAFSRDQREFKLLQVLDELPEESRDALKMKYVEGLPSKEIADRLGKSDVAIRVLLSRTLSKLQTILSKDSAFHGTDWLR